MTPEIKEHFVKYAEALEYLMQQFQEMQLRENARDARDALFDAERATDRTRLHQLQDEAVDRAKVSYQREERQVIAVERIATTLESLLEEARIAIEQI